MVRLPKSVKTIGANAFVNCRALTSLTLPAVETIGTNAFAMTKMEYLILPTTVTSVASTILRGANTQVYVRTALEDGVTTPEGWVSNWNGSNKNQTVEYNSDYIPEVKYEFVSSEIETYALGDDVDLRTGGYYVTGFQEFCTIFEDDYKEVYIPATYTGEDGIEYPIIGIDQFAFCGTFIDKVTIGYSETPITLASNAFMTHEGSLITFNRDIIFESEDFDGTMAMSESVFSCSTVSTIILPKNIESIGNYLFDGCENLRNIHFIEPNATLSASGEANINLTLTSTQIVELPNTITFIGNNAFNLTKNILELHIPSSVTYVGSNIISGWTSSQTIYVDLVSDDPILEGWNENWAFGNWNDENPRIVYKVSDKTYNITYNALNATHENPNTYKSSEGLVLSPAQKEGYTFIGWYLDENFERPIETIEVGTTGDITLYAKFSPNEYTIKYEKNCPSIASNQVLGEMSESTHTYGVDSVLNSNNYTLKGWTFTGWNTEEDGSGTSYVNSGIVTTFVESGTKKLYAQWEQIAYTIHYYGNRPNDCTSILKGNMSEETHQYEDEFNLTKVTYSLDGWTFKRWNTKADGTGISFLDEQLVKGLSETEINLYAQWEVSRYTVIYEKNTPSNTDFEVEGVMEPSTHIYDNASFLRTNSYVLEGWTFVGWNTKANGSGTQYSNGAEVQALTSNGSITLYAQWQANTYTISYNSNRPNSSHQVIGETVESIHTVDTEKLLSPNGYSLVGWTFIGWNTKSDGSGTSYTNKENVTNVTTNLSTIVLYAQWEAKSFSIQYLKNKPSLASNEVVGTTTNSNHLVDTESSLSQNGYSLIGWTFIGWNTETNGSGTQYSNGSNVTFAINDSVMNVYAQWEMNTYTIEFNSNGGVGSISSQKLGYEEEYALPYNPYTNTGKHFFRWNTENNGTGTSYIEGESISKMTSENGGRIILYALWDNNDFTISYNPNTPSNASNQILQTMPNSQHKVGIPSNLRINQYTLLGWNFEGWNTEADGTGEFYEDGSNTINFICEDGAIIPLYAQWQANTYTIKYDANLPMQNITRTDNNPEFSIHTYDTSSNFNPFFTLVSWEMTGWNYDGITYSANDKVENLATGGEITLVAQWKEKENVLDCRNSSGIYEIVSVSQLASISQGTYKLMRNLDITDDWNAIVEFNGILDLDGHTIKYQNTSLDPTQNYGFILNNKGTIKNGYFKPYIKQSSLASAISNEVYIGGVVAENNGTITNIEVLSNLGKDNDSMTLESTSTDINARSLNSFIGGLAGLNNGTIQSCKNYASLGGSYHIGGISGNNKNSAKIDGCINEGRIWYCSIGGTYRCVGGIVAGNYQNATITNCNNSAKIIFAYKTDTNTNDEMYVANIAGWSHTDAKVENCIGITNPIDILVSNLNNTELKYIKTNGENIGKNDMGPEPSHRHTYGEYVPYSISQHKAYCECGASITAPHKFVNDATGRTCTICKYHVQFNIELGFSDSLSDIYCIMPDNYILKCNMGTSEEKNEELYN